MSRPEDGWWLTRDYGEAGGCSRVTWVTRQQWLGPRMWGVHVSVYYILTTCTDTDGWMDQVMLSSQLSCLCWGCSWGWWSGVSMCLCTHYCWLLTLILMDCMDQVLWCILSHHVWLYCRSLENESVMLSSKTSSNGLLQTICTFVSFSFIYKYQS